ncbi:uncharacterized protein AB675_10857 [Cyphellophora attinorum]|uniref:Uncharacterized protein n=1 Tax=Cyphellophora attinorum TaxID=1664694 RepID=A0A0N0NMQ9_9EURO|nr:uncharacterized protein AB675_10857 [Phialophora attinorum]KPI40638.1 hypothetical protein AB675_10857 [Phialophora attinorum]
MGIIKTAMLSGVAIYGVNQIAKTAQNRGNHSNNAPAHRRDYSYDRSPPLQPLDRRQHSSSNTRDLPDADVYDYPSHNSQQRQRFRLEDPQQHYQRSPPADQRAYHHNDDSNYDPARPRNRSVYNDDYAYTSGRSPSAPPQYSPRHADNRYQAGFIEDDEVSYDPRGLQGSSSGGSKADLLNGLMQQAMGSELIGGGGKGKKGKDGGKGQLLAGLMNSK